jgi:hypothetical protein
MCTGLAVRESLRSRERARVPLEPLNGEEFFANGGVVVPQSPAAAVAKQP